jgi:TolB protein
MHSSIRSHSAFIGAFLCTSVVLPATVRATQGGDEELPRIVISDPNRDLFRLALPPATGSPSLAKSATEIERRDLDLVGLFRLLDPNSFPDALIKEGTVFSSALWSQVGAQGVAKMRVGSDASGVSLEGHLYQVGRGDSPVYTHTYRGSEIRPLVHAWVNDVIEQFTKIRGVFGSRIAFAMKGRTGEIATIGMDGQEFAVVTQMRSECLMPAFSPSGGQIAFTSFLRGGADLWVVQASGGRARKVSTRLGLNTGPTWFPSSGAIVATLSFEGNAELYKLAISDGKILGRLTHSSSNDLSASLSPDGTQVAFVSDRQGTPQIFLMPSSGGQARRLTFQGAYNQTPRFSPRADVPLIAFTGRDERLNFDIFLYDLRTGKIDRVTQGQGSNLDPSFSPDGRMLVYASSRGGLWVMNLQTRKETQIYKGGAKNTSWGPAPLSLK